MSALKEIQSQIIDILKQKAGEAGSPVAPGSVKPYGGELAGTRPVRNLPAVFVDPALSFGIEAQDAGGTIFDGDYQPELILFAQNKASGGDNVSALAELVDWVVSAIKAESITVDGEALELSRRIRGRLITDMDPASAILTLELTNFE